MAANTSQRKAQQTILASQVEAFRTWFLIVDCSRCGPRAMAMSKLPVDLTVFQVVMQMRCRVCGGGAARVSIANTAEGWRRRVVRGWGPGSQG